MKIASSTKHITITQIKSGIGIRAGDASSSHIGMPRHRKILASRPRPRRAMSTSATFVAVAAAAACTSRVVSFQPPAVIQQFTTRGGHPNCRRLKVASRESTEIEQSTHGDDDDDDDDSDSWALRQITFLGLSKDAAAPPSEDGSEALDARNLSEFLMEMGACSVSITDADADTEDEIPLFDEPSSSSKSSRDPNDHPPPMSDLPDEDEEERWAMVIPDLAAGRNLWKRCDVSAHFPSSFDVPSVVDGVRCTFGCPTTPRYRVDDVPDLDWVQHVQESWNPIVLTGSKFVLRFPWHDDRLVMRSCQEAEVARMQEDMRRKFTGGVKREGAVVHFEDSGDGDDADDSTADRRKRRDYVHIELEGGIAFGTGEHPTTQLCLGWVRDKVEERLDRAEDGGGGDLHFIDYGAGSGVLGIAAASVARDYNKSKQRQQLSSGCNSMTTVGVEIDADAIHIADDNARKNGVEMKNYLPDEESLEGEALSVVLRALQRKRNEGLLTLPDKLNGAMYDLCAANILAAPLVNLAPTIASLVKSPGGEIGLSGVLETQAESVVEAYAEFFDDVEVAGADGGWVLITGKRK